MDIYHIWFDLKDSHRDLEFCEALETYMAFLQERDLIAGHRLTRRPAPPGYAGATRPAVR